MIFFLSFSCIFPPRIELGTGHMVVTDCAANQAKFSGPLFQGDGQEDHLRVQASSHRGPTGGSEQCRWGAIGLKGGVGLCGQCHYQDN